MVCVRILSFGSGPGAAGALTAAALFVLRLAAAALRPLPGWVPVPSAACAEQQVGLALIHEFHDEFAEQRVGPGKPGT